MMSINKNNSTHLFLQEQMNKQDKTKHTLYSKEHIDITSSHLDMSNTNTNKKSNPMSIYKNNNLKMGAENSNITDNKTNINTEETISTCLQTNENINVSNQSLDSPYLRSIHLQETVQNAKYGEIDKIYRPLNKKNNTANIVTTNNKNNNANTISIECTLKKNNYSLDENKDHYINVEETEIETETEAEAEAEPQLNKEGTNQQINGYKNISQNANHLFHPTSQQHTFESSQQNLSDIYESNTYCNSMNIVPADTQQSLTNEIIKNNEYKCSEATINMQEETDIETGREYYTNFNRPIEYHNESKGLAHQEKIRNIDNDTYNDIYDPIQYHRNEISNVEKKKQEDNCSYEYWTDKYKIHRTINGINNTGVKAYDHVSELSEQNIKDMLYQINNPNYYSSANEYTDESSKRMQNLTKSIPNGTSTKTYDDTSTIIDTKHLITNEEKYERGETNKIAVDSTEFFNGIRNLEVANGGEKTLNYPNQLSQQEIIKNLSENMMMNNMSINTINTINMTDTSDLQKSLLMHNSNFYRNVPNTTNKNTNNYLNEDISNMVSMYGTMEMQNHCNEINDVMTNRILNYTAPMTRYNKYFEQTEQQEYISGKEYLNSQINKQYNLKDIKSFMLEPQLYTKMDLDIPEIVDGLTTSHQDGKVTNIKKETLIKYKDTWRLVPGKSFTIDRNDNNNSENEAKLFQESLDRYNEKTQQMFLNCTFNNLTGNFVMNPSAAAAVADNQKNKNPDKVYKYSDPVVAFPNTYIQPFVSTANTNDPTNILDQFLIDRMDHIKEYNCIGGISQFVPANEFNNTHGFSGLTQLNNLTGAPVIDAINGIHTMDSPHKYDFPSITQQKETLPLQFINSNKEPQKNQKPIMKKKISLCGEDTLKYNIKTFLTQTIKNYFVGQQSQLN